MHKNKLMVCLQEEKERNNQMLNEIHNLCDSGLTVIYLAIFAYRRNPCGPVWNAL